MKVQEIIDTFNDAMRDIRHGYWQFDGQERDRKVLAAGIMKMEKTYDDMGRILRQHEKEHEA